MDRRHLLGATAALLAATAAPDRRALAAEADTQAAAGLTRALRRFRALPGTSSYVVRVGRGGRAGCFEHRPDRLLVIVSAFKTFVLGQYLRDVEAGRRSEDEELAIDDGVRDFGSPVFENLAGRTKARSVLEAMMAHSDNTATNAAMLRVGAPRIRRLIAEAGLRSTRIPDSTRILASYILGAPSGADFGWPGIEEAFRHPPGPIRPLLNDKQTFASTSRELVCWYEEALQGSLFATAQSRTEFKRIQSMSVQIGPAVPADTLAYVKGGEAKAVFGFSAKSFAGQILVGQTPVTFSFLLNWESAQGEFEPVQAEFFASIKAALSSLKQSLE